MIPSIVARQVRETVLDYLRTTFALADADLERALLEFLGGPDGLFRGPYIDVRLPFRKADPGERIPLEIQPTFEPWKHQLKAFRRLYSRDGHQPQHTLVTTGTGSGKTECFLFPVLDHCWRHRGEPGVKGILLYPMNALASDQARRIARMLWDDPRLKGQVTAGLFVGGHGQHGAADREHLVDKREVLRDSPPDILLTNYKMLDFLLLRPEDRKLWRHNAPETLAYLVLDELHTYDGAQGSDVACLIRRLKDRLRLKAGSLCCVGTSATIGGGRRERTIQRLTEFATKIFDEEFFEEAVVTEDRMDAVEALGDAVDLDHTPSKSEWDDLDPERAQGWEAWARLQAELWLGPKSKDLDWAAVGELLKRHTLLRQLLRALAGGVKSIGDLDQWLGTNEPGWSERPAEVRRAMLESFLGLVSAARSRSESGKLRPFLQVQVQLWVRELRHLVRGVTANPVFAWSDEGLPEGGPRWLPIAHCRECGSSGLASYQRESEAQLQDQVAEIGRRWLHRERSSRLVLFGHAEGELLPEYVCPACLCIRHEQTCSCRGQGEQACLPVQIGDEVSDRAPPKFLAQCLECGSESSLSLMGSRAASLLSVTVGHLFQTAFNADKKLLAFTDSVQDASHRAGFFGARTYRFNLRTAMQAVLESREDDVSLDAFARALLDRWRPKMSRAELIATLLPSDLRDLPTYERFLEKDGAGSHTKLEEQLEKRLSWEATMEYGLNTLVGRTLDRTRCSTAGVDAGRLEKAVHALALELAENSPFENRPAEGISGERLRHFLLGLLQRVRLRGGIDHPLLEAYVKRDGNWFLLTKKKNPLLSPFGPHSVLPRFLTDRTPTGAARDAVFDTCISATNASSWLRDWAARSLGVARSDSGMNEFYREVLRRLEAASVLTRRECGNGGSAWGIDPAALRITRRVTEAVCAACRRRYTLPEAEVGAWVGKSCPRFRCKGSLSRVERPAPSYYARVYRSGLIKRIFAAEHTGLLKREDRERLEERFKSGQAPDAQNLIVCTPTLEMGIDIGDLSAAVMCSVPPTTANYLQRVGRAGRDTGNALCLTMAVSRPHDLYFHAEPFEMLAGEVLPPGCFLDAPEMLKRQLVAHAMDAWARQEETLKAIPNRTAFLLSEGREHDFPRRFLEYYQAHQAELLKSFMARFDRYLLEPSRIRIREFGSAENVPLAVRKAFEEVRAEREDLRARQRKARERLQEIEANPDTSENPDDEKAELEEARRLFSRLIRELGDKYPLNVLTDAGVLPNYAFPEPGVTLQSVVRESDDDGNGAPRYASYEYVRPASSAIRELAPFNTFYAEGRKVVIDEIDVGNKARPLSEVWRLCPECAYMERVTPGREPGQECPRCRCNGWNDAGQVRTMIHFRRARSLASRLESATVDESEDRDEKHYQLADLIDVGREHYCGARLIADLPFGYELLKGLKLREVNFGQSRGAPGGSLSVGGNQVSDEGFEVCMECGKVRDDHKQIGHAPYCTGRKDPERARLTQVFLYREVESEAIRILLPVAELDLERKRASFRAALQLGFRKWFQGDPGHLLIRNVREPIPGTDAHRQFLVVFDAVPGGTGYLADLWEKENVLAILDLALQHLQACRCQKDGRDGCYRCLFAYQEQRYLKEISSRTAQTLLREILQHRGKIAPVATLSEVSLDSVLESELEEKFFAALRASVLHSPGGTWEERIEGGERLWVFQIGDRKWELRAQILLGSRTGISVSSKPDFVIRPLDGDSARRSIAVFCDGFAYHGCPTQPVGRIGDDVAKRRALIESGSYWVWSVTWKDLTEHGEEKTSFDSGVFQTMNGGAMAGLWGKIATGNPLERKGAMHGCMPLLLAFLRHPEEQHWSQLARVSALAWIAGDRPIDVASSNRLEARLLDEVGVFVPGPLGSAGTEAPIVSRLFAHPETPWVFLLGRCSTAALREGRLDGLRIVMRLFDEWVGRKDAKFEASWRVFLHAWNLLQFHGDLELTTSEELSESYPRIQPPAAALKVAEISDDLAALLVYTSESARALVTQLSQKGANLPTVGHELADGSGRVIAEAELAWEGPRICILNEQQSEDATAFAQAGWRVFDMTVSPDAIIELVGRVKSADPSKKKPS